MTLEILTILIISSFTGYIVSSIMLHRKRMKSLERWEQQLKKIQFQADIYLVLTNAKWELEAAKSRECKCENNLTKEYNIKKIDEVIESINKVLDEKVV